MLYLRIYGCKALWVRVQPPFCFITVDYEDYRCSNFLLSHFWLISKGPGMHIKSTGMSRLESPIFPWKPRHNNISFCLQFEYKLPTNDTSKLEIQRPRNSKIYWSLTGFHGDQWHQAKVPWTDVNNSKVNDQNSIRSLNESALWRNPLLCKV
jgi:hypothetical protein